MINIICFFKGHNWKLDETIKLHFAIPLQCKICNKIKLSLNKKYLLEKGLINNDQIS